jgi:methyl-accepting chemotaxis protein
MGRWFSSLSIRWKLQFGFFLVTMVTTVYNRLLASHELGKMVEIAKASGVDPRIVSQLAANHDAYIFNSFWESGLEFLLQFFLIGLVANVFVKPIRTLCDSLKAVVQGDLTKGVKVGSRDEIGMLEESFNEVLGELNHIMREINSTGKEMEQSAFQIAKISHEIAEVGHNEQKRSDEVNAVTLQLNQVSGGVQTQASAAAGRAKETEERAREGIRMVQKNIAEMEGTAHEVNQAMHKISELEQAAGQIHEIVTTIQDIAGQTNLLALNAAIEAARAGEQGRGFAVVADEVRKLAERTNSSAGEISDIIGQVSGKMHEVTASMNVVVGKVHDNQKVAGETASVIEHMSNDVAATASANEGISNISGEQIRNVHLLEKTLEELFATLNESATKVETTAAISDNLHKVTGSLNQLMAGFTFESLSAIEEAQNEKRQHPRAANRLLVKVTQEGNSFECTSLDFSLSGIRLQLDEKLNENAPVELAINVPRSNLSAYQQQQPLLLSGEIRWQRTEDGRLQCGIVFVNISADADKSLRECFKYYNKTAEFRS